MRAILIQRIKIARRCVLENKSTVQTRVSVCNIDPFRIEFKFDICLKLPISLNR